MKIDEIKDLLKRVSMTLFDTKFYVRVDSDLSFAQGRVFVQIVYHAPCTKTNTIEMWKGRKWYLSEHMTTDEIIKTAYAAFQAAVTHEIMEGFKVDGIILFNPHVSFEALLAISDQEVRREETVKPI